MNLDQLTEAIKASTEEKLPERLEHWIKEWKKDDNTVDDLVNMVEKWFGNVWFEKESDHQKCYDLWKDFKKKESNRRYRRNDHQRTTLPFLPVR